MFDVRCSTFISFLLDQTGGGQRLRSQRTQGHQKRQLSGSIIRTVIPVVIRANTGPIANRDTVVPALTFAAAFLAFSSFGSVFLEVIQIIANPTVFAAASINERIFFSFIFHRYLPVFFCNRLAIDPANID
jgi:hypothetical protein